MIMHIETDDLVQKLSENDEKFLVASIIEKFDRFNFVSKALKILDL